ncbi:quinolinate synthase A [Bacteroides sp. CAG:1076]|nr:quinolinate synthase A [Bacteroides sp. CAG:1076]CCY92816.1 quinolinate synthase A [Bacteroides sp. CAG:1076]
MNKEEWLKRGYVTEPVDKALDLKAEIDKLRKEKNAVILGHYYQADEIQEIADFIGDSLALAQWAAKTDADIIVMCGVHFMGETAKILCPDKKVLIPDLNAGCSLADSCPADEFSQFVKEHPDHTVISYVNTSAAVKAVTDVVVTSTNAKQIVESFPKEQKIIFGPDKNLGNYINSITNRSMLLWDGACHVHEKFSVEKIIELKKQYPDADVLVHPECKGAVAKLADKVGSTAGLLKYAMASDKKNFIVATESGILYEMRKKCPNKNFIPAPPEDSTCACNECNFMRLNTLEKLYNTLKYEWPEVKVDNEIAEKAVRPIKKMLEISAKLGL